MNLNSPSGPTSPSVAHQPAWRGRRSPRCPSSAKPMATGCAAAHVARLQHARHAVGVQHQRAVHARVARQLPLAAQPDVRGEVGGGEEALGEHAVRRRGLEAGVGGVLEAGCEKSGARYMGPVGRFGRGRAGRVRGARSQAAESSRGRPRRGQAGRGRSFARGREGPNCVPRNHKHTQRTDIGRPPCPRTGPSTTPASCTTSKAGESATSTSTTRATSTVSPTREATRRRWTFSRWPWTWRRREWGCPCCCASRDILRTRIETLGDRFATAIQEFGYEGELHHGVPHQGQPAAPRGGGDRGVRRAARGGAGGGEQAGAAGRAGPHRAHGPPDRVQRLQGRGVHAAGPDGPEAGPQGAHRHREAERGGDAAARGGRDGRGAHAGRAHQAHRHRRRPLERDGGREEQVRAELVAAGAACWTCWRPPGSWTRSS